MTTEFQNPYTIEYGSIIDRIRTDVTIRCKNLSITVKAMWDTGAQLSCVSKRVAEKLNPELVGETTIHGASGYIKIPVYELDIILPGGNVFTDLRVCEADMAEDSEDVIIGMNIIQLADFAITNSDGHTIFTYKFPSVHKTDYVKEEEKPAT